MRLFFVALVLVMAIMACRTSPPERRELNLYPSPTTEATQTPVVVQITTTPPFTYTPIVIEVTNTPKPVEKLCVSALETVHLRPSANTLGYPILVLENGTVVEDLGGRDGKWFYVRYVETQGWVDSNYLTACSNIGD